MHTSTGVFEININGDTLTVVPCSDLRELAYEQIETGAKDILSLLESMSAKHVVMDFEKTDYYGSTALAFFVRLWKRVRKREGNMAFCNVSAHELDILKITKLDSLWPICKTRQEAMDVVKQQVV